MNNIFWKWYSNDDRHASINTIKSVVAKYGDMVEFKLFSDTSLTMVIEIEEYKINNLYSELTETIGIEKFTYLDSMSKRERSVYLNITFAKGTGNLIIQIPSL